MAISMIRILFFFNLILCEFASIKNTCIKNKFSWLLYFRMVLNVHKTNIHVHVRNANNIWKYHILKKIFQGYNLIFLNK